ncbi:MAG: hypothetical protein IPO41_07630 [Acidobacteria bacterium]|nr:hypothetical protein [Acidobacteriota bacterium]MBK9528178.1 hypothetical protein [Acidobacteriota bacterium]MBP7474187.1 hypothetical protein [Pyrinomonadaceae bacterium]MBP9108369.1 hypothetical protein [Pyrinomonadaceae bacterium]
MELAEIATYTAFGFAFLATMYPMVFSGHLWKSQFFRRCLVISVFIALVGVILEISQVLGTWWGLTGVVMFIPIFYVGNFQFWRKIFLRYFGTEPYVTSSASTVGSIPLDTFTSEGQDGETRKFAKDRRVGSADFLFSFATHLIPALSIGAAIYFLREFNK